jgi:RNA polymerase sigma-70 factor, ECF subfamily
MRGIAQDSSMTAAPVGPCPTDEDLFLAFARHRDTIALGELFRRRAAELLQLAATLGPVRSDAEDLLQATFVTAMRDARRFDARRRVMPWLCGILANHARAARRARRREPAPQRGRDGETAIEPLLRAEVGAAVERGIAAMAAPYRSVLLLQLRQGLDGPAIARRLGSNPAAVRKQLSRAYALLRQAMPVGLSMGLALAALPAHALPPAALATTWRWRRSMQLLGAAAVLFGASAWALSSAQPMRVAQTASASLDRPTARDDAVLVAAELERTAQAMAPAVAPAEIDAQLRVAVRFRDGTRASGIPVQALPLGSEPPAVRSHRAPVGVSDPLGIVLFPSLPPGAVAIGSIEQLPFRRVELHAGRQTEAELVLDGPFPIEGTVIDERGAPIADARIAVGDSGGRHENPVTVATTDALGHFHFVATRVDPKLFARAAGFGDSWCQRAGERQLVLQLRPAAPPLGVLVRGRDGQPVADAHVAAVPAQAGRQQAPLQHARSDANGRVHFDTLPAGAIAVVVRHPGCAPVCAHRAADADDPTLVISLSAPAHIDGWLPLGSGMPRPLRVFAAPTATNKDEPVSMLMQCMADVADDGSFTLPEVPCGPVVVRVMHERRSAAMQRADLPLQVAVACVELAAGERRHLQLEPLELVPLHGTVTLAVGEPASGWTVTAAARDLRGPERRLTLLSGTTGTDGRFLLTGADPRTDYDLFVHPPERRASDPNWFPSAVGLSHADGARLRVDALPPATLRLAPGDPEVEVTLCHAIGPHRVRMPAGADGWRSLVELPAGDYRLEVSVPGRGATAVDLQLRGGETVVPLPSLRAPSLPFVTRPNGGAPITAALVDERGLEQARATGSLPLHLPAVQPGRYRLRTFGPDHTACEQHVELASGPQRLRPRDDDGAPCKLLITLPPHDNPLLLTLPSLFRLERLDGRLHLQESLTANGSGAFEFVAPLPPGDYRVSVATLWGRRGRWQVSVGAEGLAATLRLAGDGR